MTRGARPDHPKRPLSAGRLDDDLFARWSAAAPPRGGAVLLVTLDRSGLPRTALLAPALVVAPSPRRVLFPLAPRSRSARNLSRPGAVGALFWAAPGAAVSVSGRVAPLAAPMESLPGARIFALSLGTTKRDAPLAEEKGARMTGGLPFAAPAPLRAAWRRARRELIKRGRR